MATAVADEDIRKQRAPGAVIERVEIYFAPPDRVDTHYLEMSLFC